MEDIESKIRAVLISYKGKSDLRTLRKDYCMLMGEEIPYTRYGCKNLEEFIQKCPSLSLSLGPNNTYYVEAESNDSSKHIVKLISKQKSSKKSKPSRLPIGRHFNRFTIPVVRRETRGYQEWRRPYVNKSQPRPHVHQLVDYDQSNRRSFRRLQPPPLTPLLRQTSMHQRLAVASTSSAVISSRNILSSDAARTPLGSMPLSSRLKAKSITDINQVPLDSPSLPPNRMVRSSSITELLPAPSHNMTRSTSTSAANETPPALMSLPTRLMTKQTPANATASTSTSSVPLSSRLATKSSLNTSTAPTSSTSSTPLSSRLAIKPSLITTTASSLIPLFSYLTTQSALITTTPPTFSTSSTFLSSHVTTKSSAVTVPTFSSSESLFSRHTTKSSTTIDTVHSSSLVNERKFPIATTLEDQNPNGRHYTPLFSSSLNYPPQPQQSPAAQKSLEKGGGDADRSSITSTIKYSVFDEVQLYSKLKALVEEFELGEITTKFVNRTSKKNKKKCLHDCVIKIDNHSYSSYPKDCYSEAEALTEAASKAFSEISLKRIPSLEKKNSLIATEYDVINRLPPLIEKHFHGIWASQVELDYEEMYNERLPLNWLSLLDTIPQISVEPTVQNKYVLKYVRNNVLQGASPNLIISEVSVPSNTIKVTEEGWAVEITYVASTVEIWCRSINSDSHEKFLRMSDSMQLYYSRGNKTRATVVAVGGFYAVFCDNCWVRVRIIATREHEVICFLIDYGDEYTIAKSDLFILERNFSKPEAQAFVCRLSGLEELANMEFDNEILNQISNKVYYAKPHLEEGFDVCDCSVSIPIVLYETNDHKNINAKLTREITENTIQPLSDKHINYVYVSCAYDSGYIYVQPDCEASEKIRELISFIDSSYVDLEKVAIHALPIDPSKFDDELKNKIFLTRWSQNNKLYRCKISECSPCGNYFQLIFIDHGITEIVMPNHNPILYPLEKISSVLEAFPSLAYKVKLDIYDKFITKNSHLAKKITDIMPSNLLVILKINSYEDDEEKTPICELYKRAPNGCLLTLTGSLTYQDLSPTSASKTDKHDIDKSAKLMKKLERLKVASTSRDIQNISVPSTGDLKTPTIPVPGEYLDIFVSSAVNPWNFFVQPFKTMKCLKKLMDKIQVYYSDEENVNKNRVHLDEIRPGKIFASQYSDGLWYRISVVKVINSGSISVFYADVGYYANLTVEKVFHIDPTFLSLTSQALKARMANVKPKNMKWSLEDCKYFQSLVQKKLFVSIVSSIEQDELYKYDTVLCLRIIDTNNPIDKYLDVHLIEAGIADPEFDTNDKTAD